MYHKQKICLNSRGSHQSCSIEKAIFKNFAIFTGKHLSLFNRAAGLKTCNYIKRDCFFVNIVKILRTPIFKKSCKQLLLQFLLFTVNIFSQGFPSALNSISLFSSRSSLRFKEFSLGCLVVDSSFIRKEEELAKMATRVTRCHSLSLVVTRSLYHSFYHLLSLVVTRCHWMYHSSIFL